MYCNGCSNGVKHSLGRNLYRAGRDSRTKTTMKHTVFIDELEVAEFDSRAKAVDYIEFLVGRNHHIWWRVYSRLTVITSEGARHSGADLESWAFNCRTAGRAA